VETIDIRNMHDIHWYKRIVLLTLLWLVSTEAIGQGNLKDNMNFWEFRNKPFYFGLTVGVHSTGYIPNKSSQFAQSDSISFVAGSNLSGLNVNIISNLKIGQYFDFRFIPGFAFSERKMVFTDLDNLKDDQKINQLRIESVFLEIPLHLRFKSDPYKDKRFFVVGGLKYSYDVASNSSTRQSQRDKLLQIAPHDFQLEVGAGMQLFFPFFIFSPEIKFSRGLSNIHIYNSQLEGSRVIDKILSRAFTISFHFEG